MKGIFPYYATDQGIKFFLRDNYLYHKYMIEGYHSQIRKVTKDKDAFTHNIAFEKLSYLIYQNVRKK